MSEVQNHLGEKFKETIAEAMKTGDFRALNTLVSDTVNDALREADFQANLSREAAEKRVWNSQQYLLLVWRRESSLMQITRPRLLS